MFQRKNYKGKFLTISIVKKIKSIKIILKKIKENKKHVGNEKKNKKKL